MEKVFACLVGLGNPGREYEQTRHNAGFMILDRLAREKEIKLDRKNELFLWGEGKSEGRRIILAKPLTYMNVSGRAVKSLFAREMGDITNLLVICDDVAIPLGSLRIRAHGSSGGHNGLESIIKALGSKEFVRLRVGVGSESRAAKSLADYVLGKFKKEEMKTFEKIAKPACDALLAFCHKGYPGALACYSQYYQTAAKGE